MQALSQANDRRDLSLLWLVRDESFVIWLHLPTSCVPCRALASVGARMSVAITVARGTTARSCAQDHACLSLGLEHTSASDHGGLIVSM
jgi:hypothetical protein